MRKSITELTGKTAPAANDILVLVDSAASPVETKKVTWTNLFASPTITTPVIASLYQDAGRTKLMTIPVTASDTLAALAATQVLTNKTLTSPTINGTIATTGLTLPSVTLAGTVTVGGQAFDAGAGSAQINTTGAGQGLQINSTQDGTTGSLLQFYHNSGSPAQNDYIGYLKFVGEDSTSATFTYSQFSIKIEDPTNGAEESKLEFNLAVGGAVNTALTLSGAGGLGVDADIGTADDPVALFDGLDDAMILRRGIQQRNTELLADIGVFTRKDTGSGYMMNIQPMVRLLAGGIYQSRIMIDELQNKVEQLENKLLLLEVG